MIQQAARLALVVIVALGLRAASGQQQYLPPQPYAQQPQQAAYSVPPPAPPTEVFRPAEIMARVGDRCIFYADLGPAIDLLLDPQLTKIKQELARKAAERQLPPAELQARLEEVEREFQRQGRTAYAKPVLEQLVTSKMLYLEFDREIRKNAKDKYGEARANIDKKLRSLFDEQLSRFRDIVKSARPEEVTALMNQSPVAGPLAALMHNHNLESLGELDAKLRTMGTSFEQQLVQFGEGILGRETVNKHINQKPTVTHQEMLDYYQEHLADFAVPAKARFEILTVKWDSHPDRPSARNALAAMGNQVIYGKPLPAVARELSQEPNAKSGGQYDWVTKGSLASRPVDAAVFSLEPNKLSQIIDDDVGCHIVRVLERQEAGTLSFFEMQPKIKEALVQQKKREDQRKFLAELQKNTQVWTVFDAPATP